ncbi:MAG: leucine-rich repeat protein [Prevotella sp.]|nr:leucine-rich repeat protein [Prevotella sp.]MBR1462455.1 leucine-rich repeat protein [Prevotella sp.]
MKVRYFLFCIAATVCMAVGSTSCTINIGDDEEESFLGQNPNNPHNPTPENPGGFANGEYVEGRRGYYFNGAFYMPNGNDATFVRLDNPEATTFSIPESVTIMGKTYPVTSIAEQAFGGIQKLTAVTLPATIKTIGPIAFVGCENLKEVKCLATTPPVIDIPWEGASGFDWELLENGKLYVPAASIDAYKAAKGWKEFKNIVSL